MAKLGGSAPQAIPQPTMPVPQAPQAPTQPMALQPPQQAPMYPQAAPGYPQPTNGQQAYAPQAPVAPTPAPAFPQPQMPMGGMADQMTQMMAGSQPMSGAAGSAMLRGLNLTDVNDSGGYPLPLKDQLGNPISYEAVIIKVTPDKSAPGNDKIELQLRVTFPVEHANVVLYDNLTFGDKALWKVKSLMRATGTLSPDGSVFTGESEQDWVGNVVAFNIRHDDSYDGTPRNKIANGFREGTQSPGLQPG